MEGRWRKRGGCPRDDGLRGVGSVVIKVDIFLMGVCLWRQKRKKTSEEMRERIMYVLMEARIKSKNALTSDEKETRKKMQCLDEEERERGKEARCAREYHTEWASTAFKSQIFSFEEKKKTDQPASSCIKRTPNLSPILQASSTTSSVIYAP
jgi:hypothetical protein